MMRDGRNKTKQKSSREKKPAGKNKLIKKDPRSFKSPYRMDVGTNWNTFLPSQSQSLKWAHELLRYITARRSAELHERRNEDASRHDNHRRSRSIDCSISHSGTAVLSRDHRRKSPDCQCQTPTAGSCAATFSGTTLDRPWWAPCASAGDTGRRRRSSGRGFAFGTSSTLRSFFWRKEDGKKSRKLTNSSMFIRGKKGTHRNFHI